MGVYLIKHWQHVAIYYLLFCVVYMFVFCDIWVTVNKVLKDIFVWGDKGLDLMVLCKVHIAWIYLRIENIIHLGPCKNDEI